jgi:hypothetical protein
MAAYPLKIILHDDDDEETATEIGEASLGEDGALTIMRADPQHAEMLADMAEEVNGMDDINVEMPPPEGARPMTKYTRKVERGAEEFPDALRGFLRTYFDVELRPTSLSRG